MNICIIYVYCIYIYTHAYMYLALALPRSLPLQCCQAPCSVATPDTHQAGGRNTRNTSFVPSLLPLRLATIIAWFCI